MKVLFIENAGNRSAGAFHSLVALIKLLSLHNVECHVAVPDRADGIALLSDNNIPFIPMRACSYTWIISKEADAIEKVKMPFKNIAVKLAVRQLVQYINENEIDIVHENTSACYIGYYAAKHTHKKHVWHIREFMEEDFNVRIWNRKQFIRMMNDSDAVIAISGAIYNKYKTEVNGDILKLIYNGIRVEDFYLEEKELFLDGVNLLSVGRLCPGKGQMELLEAIKLLNDIYGIRVCAKFAGAYKQEYYELLMKYVEDNDLNEQVTFLGQCDDMIQLYREADIFCMCSKKEAFGRVTVEAMLAGDFVIGANSGGTTEIIENNVSGMLYQSGDSRDLANKLYYAVMHKDEAIKMAKNGTSVALAKFSASQNAENILAVYNEIMHK